MRVEELMSHPATTCHVNDPLSVAAQLMWDHDCGALPVVNDEGKLTGMITDRDICMAAYTRGCSLDAILVNRAMATHVIAVRGEQMLAEVEELMAKNQLRRLPVVDDVGTPIGVISLNDLATESVQPDSEMKHGLAKIAHTLAAICAHGETKSGVIMDTRN